MRQQLRKRRLQFDRVFKQHDVPEDIPEFAADLTPNDEGHCVRCEAYQPMRAWLNSAPARPAASIDGGGVKVNGEAPVTAKSYNVDPSDARRVPRHPGGQAQVRSPCLTGWFVHFRFARWRVKKRKRGTSVIQYVLFAGLSGARD